MSLAKQLHALAVLRGNLTVAESESTTGVKTGVLSDSHSVIKEGLLGDQFVPFFGQQSVGDVTAKR